MKLGAMVIWSGGMKGTIIGGPAETADGRRFWWVMTDGEHGVPTTVNEQYLTEDGAS